jgi:hypothetical protein
MICIGCSLGENLPDDSWSALGVVSTTAYIEKLLQRSVSNILALSPLDGDVPNLGRELLVKQME